MKTISIKNGPLKLSVAFNADDQSPAEILISQEIGKDPWTGDGLSPEDIKATLDAIQPRGRPLNVLINSPGGFVADGVAIRNLFQQWPGEITQTIIGRAASAASWCVPADRTKAYKSSQIFVHRAWGGLMVTGNADDIAAGAEEAVKFLNTADEQISEIYADQTGQPKEEMFRLMEESTLMTGAKARELGFVDELIDGDPVSNFSAQELRSMRRHLASLNALRTQFSAPTQAEKPSNHQPQPKDPLLMNREKMLALLNKWGVTVPDNASDDQLLQLIEAGKPAAAPAPPPPPLDVQDELKALRAERKREAANRIARELDQLVLEDRLTAEEARDWLPKCLADETILNTLQKRPQMLGGTEPLAHARIVSNGNPLIDEFNGLEAGAARRIFLRRHHANLRNALLSFNPRNANTIDAALTTAFLSDALVTVATTKLAIISQFVRDVGADPLKPKATVQVRKALTAATGQQNPTDFESGDSVLDNIAVTVNQESLSFNMNNADMLGGSRLEHIAQLNAEAFALQLSKLVTAVMTTGNYGTAITIGAAANFDADGLSPVLAAAKNYRQKNLLLDGGHLAYITPKTTQQLDWANNGAFGFNMIAEQNDWTGATANTVGFVSGPDAIAIASGTSYALPGDFYESITRTTLPNGLVVQTATWFAQKGRVFWVAHDTMFGVAAGDTTQAELLITA